LLKDAAPALASAALGPLGGIAASFLSDKLGVPKEDLEATLQKPETRIRLAELDQEWKLAVMAHERAKRDQDIVELRAYLEDTANARATHGQNRGVFWLGVAILGIFAAVICLVLWGSFAILQGSITIKDVAVVAAVFGLIGTVVGYAAANAQQVVGYFFGSSKGSADTRQQLGDAVKALGQRG
jgi:hypothetical protein